MSLTATPDAFGASFGARNLAEEIGLHDAAGGSSFSGSRLAFLDTGPVYCDYELVRCDESATVDLSRVIGTSHPDYAGSTWSELVGRPFGCGFASLKRLEQALKDLNSNPGYYLSDETKMHWTFLEVDGLLYWLAGSHRTCVARYFLDYLGLPSLVHGVSLAVYRSSLPTS